VITIANTQHINVNSTVTVFAVYCLDCALD